MGEIECMYFIVDSEDAGEQSRIFKDLLKQPEKFCLYILG